MDFETWNNTLKDMHDYSADRLVAVSRALQSIGLTCSGNEELTPEIKARIQQHLKTIKIESGFLGLNLTKRGAERFLLSLAQFDGWADALDDLQRRFDDEIDNIKFFWTTPERAQFYNNTTLAGEQFKANFSKGNAELIEAGNSLALDRYTACVFHLMRAFEIALTSLEKKLGVVRPSNGPEKTWGRTLARIKDRMAQNNKMPTPNWPTEKEFYEKAFAFLTAIKTPLRDDTMHVETTYDEQGALSVFNVSLEALRFLATNLAE
jgi:hypothetical protein